MMLNDPELTELIKKQIPVEICGTQYLIQSQKSGLCDNCYFEDKDKCPTKAVSICCSNGGNILKILEPTK